MLKTKDFYTEKDMIKLDMEMNFIPLTFDGIFKGIFKKDLELLKKFILSQLEFDIDLDKCKIELLDSELPKDKSFEYQKTVDIYVKIGNLYVNIEINREYFRTIEKRNFIFAEKLHAMLLERGENIKSLDDKIFVQINLNAIDKLDDKKEKLSYGTDTIVLYGMKTGKVIDMSQNRRYFEDWELEQLNKLVEYKKEQFAIEDGLKQGLELGLEQGIQQGI